MARRPPPRAALTAAASPPALGRALAAAVFVGMALGPLNSAMIAVALVSIQRDFAVSLSAATVLVSAFYLATTVGQSLMGRLADVVGPRRVFVAGLAVVAATSLLAPLAPSLPWVVAARVVLALGTSVGFPAGLALIRRASDASGAPAAGALGGIMTAAAVSAAFGPVVGGLLVGLAGWEAIFVVNVPLAMFGIALGLRALPRDEHTAAVTALLRSVDWAGVLLFAAMLLAVLAFLLGLRDGAPWWLLVVGAASAAGLAARERRARTPFIDVTVAGDRRLGAIFAQYAGINIVFYATYFAIPQWLEQARGHSAEEVGLIMLSLAIPSLVATQVAARVTPRHGPRPALLAGGAALLAGTALLLALDTGTPLAVVVAVGIVLGIPNGANNIGMQALLYARATRRNTGAAAGFFQTSRYAGAIVATAVLGAVLGDRATTGGLHDLALIAAPIAAILLVATIRSAQNGKVLATDPTK